MKREVPLAIVLILGIIMIIQYFIPHSYSQAFFDSFLDFLRISSVPAALLGLVSVVRVHYSKIKRQMPGFVYSIVTLVFMATMIIFGLYDYRNPHGVFRFIFANVEIPIESTMFSLLAFYVASAAYRSFRARNIQASILLAAALIVMIGRTSLWDYIPVIGHWFPWMTDFLMSVPNLAAKRGIYLGMALGSIATSLKIILGIERSYLGSAGGAN